MSKSLYLECYSGISGDMTVGALLDLGADQDVLTSGIASLGIGGYTIEITKVEKSGIIACDFNVVLDHDNHDHDMEYLHGHEHNHEHHHHHEHDHHHEQMHEHHGHYHCHNHDHSHEHHDDHHSHHHHHEHRNLADILCIINSSKITNNAKKISSRIFEIIAEAEAKAHGKSIDEVHFHEVGAVDSIIDIVAVGICLDNLGIHDVIIPEVCEGRGTVRCQHGILPIPVPAVTNIVAAHNIRLKIIDVDGELVTPTGAAIVAAIQTKAHLPKSFKIEKIGSGAGKRKYKVPGILRAMIINPSDDCDNDQMWKIESNIDDCTGEALGYVMEKLIDGGARDVQYTPIFMKKNRPAYEIGVICDNAHVDDIEKIIFENTTTIGVRKMSIERTILQREPQVVTTTLGEAKFKVCYIGDKKRFYPEYESIKKLCETNDMPYYEVYQQILSEANGKI